MRGPIRWAQTCGAQNRREAPLTHAAHSRSFGSAFFNSRTASEGRLCSPRAAGRGKHASALSRRAIAPESCQPPRARKKTEGGGAPKGACHPLSALSQTSIRSMRHSSAARTRAKRGALAFRRFAADSPRQSQPALAQPQAVFPGTRLRRVSPAFACPSPARSAQTGHFAGPTVSRAARERTANPHAGTASRSASRSASRKRPSDERDFSSLHER